MTEEHFRRLENMYLAAPANETYRPKIKIREGEAEVRIEIHPHHHHAAHAAHGSVYFKAMDDAAFFAVNSLVKDVFVLIPQTQIAAAVNVAEARLEDERGRTIGHGTGTFVRSKFNLVDAEGYDRGV